MTIPVTILGGFLGAGKTTALNALLRSAHVRVAVLVNDFGSIDIDASLITAREGGMVSLSSGCVCCSLGPDLCEGVERLVRLDPPPECIVVEASGVSDPWRIAQLVQLEAGVHLDAVLVLVDAVRFPALVSDRWLADTLARQVARADLVVLTHTDLASPAEIAATHAILQRLRPGLAVTAMPGDGLPIFLGAVHAQPSRFSADAAPDHDFRHITWRPGARVDRARLLAVLDGLPESVLRVKGFCRVGPAGTPHLVQRTGHRTTLQPWSQPIPHEAVVLIGTPEMSLDPLAALDDARLMTEEPSHDSAG